MRRISLCSVLIFTSAIATSALAACDAEWHQEGARARRIARTQGEIEDDGFIRYRED